MKLQRIRTFAVAGAVAAGTIVIAAPAANAQPNCQQMRAAADSWFNGYLIELSRFNLIQADRALGYSIALDDKASEAGC